MNRIDVPSKSTAALKTTLATESRLRPAGLAVAISSVLGLAMPGGAAMAANSVITVHDDAAKKTATTVSSSGNTVTVTTATVKNGVAFNSFKDFNVAQNDVVNLVLPGVDASKQVNNLVNLVWDSKIYIDGTLNSVLESTNKVGGRVFFVDPKGMVVGNTGVLNVGSLTVATPRTGVMGDILASRGALNRLMAGTLTPEQISTDGAVSVAGTVNARNGVRVQARAIDVTGTILVAVPADETFKSEFNLQRDDAAVNTGGDDSKIVLVDDGNGKIQLRAAAISDTGLGVRSAEATVTIGCDVKAGCGPSKLQADDIELTALAVVDSSYDKDKATLAELEADLVGSMKNTGTLIGLGDALLNFGVDKVLGEQISVLHATTTSRVEVKNTAELQASNAIDLHASTRQIIDNSAAGEVHETNDPALDANGQQIKDPITNKPVQKRQLFSLGAAYGQINATTEALIRSGAAVSAGGDLSVKADAETAVKIAAESIAVNNTTVGFTAAISNVNVNTRAVIEGNNASSAITAGAVNVSAVNQASLETKATSRGDGSNAVGLAGAISLQDIAAEAKLERDVTTNKAGGSTGDVTVQAATITSLNRTDTLVGSPKLPPLPFEEEVKTIGNAGEDAGEGFMGMAQSLVGSGFSAALGALSGDSGGGTGGGTTQPSKPAAFRLGGAISFVSGDHAATASIGDNVVVNSAGNVVVDSQVVAAQIGNHAISNVAGKGKDAEGSKFGLSGAVTIADLNHDAKTLIGSGAQLSGQHIGLASDVSLPRDFSKLTGMADMFSSFDEFKEAISNAKDLITDPSDLFTSYAAARGSADKFALGGAVSYFKASNSARTDVASGAQLTTRDASGAAWTAALDGLDHRENKTEAERARSRSFDAATDISATTDVTALHAAGDLALKNIKTTNVGDGGAAVGGSVGYMDYENTAAAIVNDRVQINAGGGEIAVNAANKETVVSLALQSGNGGSFNLSGTASALDLDSHTLAGVSDKALLTAKSVGIGADEDLFVWSVAGAVAMSNSISVGLSVAYQDMNTDTNAFIGTIPSGFSTGTSGVAQGKVNTGELSVKASSEGLAGAVAAAGSVVSSKDNKYDQGDSEQAAKKRSAENPGFIDGLKSRASSKVTGLETMAGKAGMEGDSGLAAYFGKAKSLLGSGKPEQGGQAGGEEKPKFGVAVSGSATVNRARQKTVADISNANIKDNSGTGVKLDVLALNKTLLVSISGALSVVVGQQQSSASIAGGVAYGDIKNTTRAGITNSTVENANDVVVTARNESEQVNVGLGVGVNASSDQSKAAAVAVSATVGMSENTTEAVLQGGSITGKQGAGADVSLKAVNESKIANGGGALYVGGRAGVGAAVTYAEVKDATSAAITGGTISQVDNVSVRAADASRIIAAAAAGGVSTASNGVGLAGSVLINQVSNTTSARIDGGATVDIAGNLDVYAGTAHDSDVSGVGGDCKAGGVSSGGGMDYCGKKVAESDVKANADTESSSDTKVNTIGRDGTAKSSIIAVAGMMQVSDNNVGVAFAYNTIKNTHGVSVDNASIKAAGADGVSLMASDKAQIIAVSAGIGASTGKVAGVGSVSYNAIANQTTVQVGHNTTGLTSATLDAQNIHLDASDDSFIGSFAGAATLGPKVGIGAALTINDIDNETKASSQDAALVATQDVTLAAANNAKILSGAVAAGFAGNVAVQGSVGWSEIGNTAEASIEGGTAQAAELRLDADNDSRIYTLSGAIAGSGGPAAVGAAVNVATISDTTTAAVENAALEVANRLAVSADADAVTKTLAIGGALGGTASIAASNATNIIRNNTTASLNHIDSHGKGVDGTVEVSADTRGASYSLGGALAVGSSVGVGVASSINDVGGRTSATVNDASLDDATRLAILANNSSLIRTAAVAGAAGGSAGVAGSVTGNIIRSDTLASLVDTKVNNSAADVIVRADDQRAIDSLAGGAAVGGTAGVGAAVAYNDIGGSTSALVSGKLLDLDVRNLEVTGDAAGGTGNRIRAIAAGVGVGGSVGGAGSVAVNKMGGTVSAIVDGGADVIAERSIEVSARQRQQIDVLAGALAGGATAGVGIGVVVNMMQGTTEAAIRSATNAVGADRTQATALGLGQNGGGVIVKADTDQAVRTLGVSAAVAVNIVSAAGGVMSATNVLGSRTNAEIANADINMHDLSYRIADGTAGGGSAGPGTGSDDSAGDPAANIRLFGDASQRVAVDARSKVDVSAITVGAGLATGVGGSAAVNTNVFKTQTNAAIRDSNVLAVKRVDVVADAQQAVTLDTTGFAAGGAAAASGAVLVNVFGANTGAVIEGGSTTANAVNVKADNDAKATLRAEALAGAGGAAASLGAVVNIVDTNTEARVGSIGRSTKVRSEDDITVDAASATKASGLVVSAAGAGGVGVAGMAQLHQITSNTSAAVVGADMAGRNMTVNATEALELDALAGAGAVGGAGVGVGAGVNLALLGSHVGASVSDSQLVSSGKVDVNALSERDIAMTTATAGIGGSAGIGGAVGILLSGKGTLGSDMTGSMSGTFTALQGESGKSKLSGDVSGDASLKDVLDPTTTADLNSSTRRSLAAFGSKADTVSAKITGGSIQSNAIDVTADTRLVSVNRAGAAGLGVGVGVGGAVAYTGMAGITEATLAANAVKANDIRVKASSGALGAAANSVVVDTYAGAGGAVGIGAAVSIADLGQGTNASLAGNLTSKVSGKGEISVSAEDTHTIKADATGAGVGGLAAVGAVVAKASRDAIVSAQVASNTALNNFNSITVNALHGGGAVATGLGSVAGFGAALQAVVVDADDSSEVVAEFGNNVDARTVAQDVTGKATGIQVNASSTSSVVAKGTGATVSGGVAVGAVVANAEADTNVSARIGTGAKLNGTGDVLVSANRTVAQGKDTARAEAKAGSGGIYGAATAASAQAKNTGKVTAGIGNNAVVGGGDLKVLANHVTSQNAYATGVAVGGLAVGLALSEATSDTTTAATLGNGANGAHAGTKADAYVPMGDVVVSAVGEDANLAHSVAGSGGLLAGAGSKSVTIGKSKVDALIGSSVGASKKLVANSLSVNAGHTSKYGAQSDARSAGLVNASGAVADNRVDSSVVNASIGADSKLQSMTSTDVVARNSFASLLDGAAINAASGGALGMDAGGVTTVLNSASNAWIGDRVNLISGTSAGGASNGNVRVLSATDALASDKAELSTGGLIRAATVSAKMDANFTNNSSIGNNAVISAADNVSVGSYVHGNLYNDAIVNTWGLAAVGNASSRIDADVRENVSIGSGAKVSSGKSTFLTAGRAGATLEESALVLNSVAEGYVRGLVAVPIAKSRVNADVANKATLASGAEVKALGDVYIGAYGAEIARRASGRATGYQLGFIPITVNDADTSGAWTGSVVINGTALAGAADNVNVNFSNLAFGTDADGSLTCTGATGVSYGCMTLGDLRKVTGDDSLGGELKDSDRVVVLDDLKVAGGDVFLNGSSITGSGKVTARTAPSIDITNTGDLHLVTSKITIPDYAGGKVHFTGTQTGFAGAQGSASAGVNPHINITTDSRLAFGSSIFQMGRIDALGADVKLVSKTGSIFSSDSIYAAKVSIDAAQGNYVFNNPNANMANFSSETLWQGYMLKKWVLDVQWRNIGGVWLPFPTGTFSYSDYSGNELAAYLANAEYGRNAGSTDQLNETLLKQAPWDRDYGGTAVIMFGACLPHVRGCGDNQSGDSDNGYIKFPYNPGNTQWVPKVPKLTLEGSASYAAIQSSIDAAAANPDNYIKAREVRINANYIDVNGRIEAGAGVDWSVIIKNDSRLDDLIARANAEGKRVEVDASYLDTTSAASNLITVFYDPGSRRFVVDDVNASGGGKVYLNGKIVSTTNRGSIQVTSGFGNVSVQSLYAGVDVELGSMNVASGEDGIVQITDKNKRAGNPAFDYVTWYVSSPDGTKLALDNSKCMANCASWTYEDAQRAGSYAGSTTAYNPEKNQVYQWRRTAYIGRNVDLSTGIAGDWDYVSSNDPNTRVPTNERWTSNGAYGTGSLAKNTDFTWEVDGDVLRKRKTTVGYGCDFVERGKCNFDFPTPANGWHVDPDRIKGKDKNGYETWYGYEFPTYGKVWVTGTVRADNAIAINFVTGSSGKVDVSVANSLLLGGTINNKAGTTSLVARNGSITQINPTATLYSKDLVLKATDAIGRVPSAFGSQIGDSGLIDIVMTGGGTLRASTNRGGIGLDVHSDVNANISAGADLAGRADVVLLAGGSITGAQGNAPSIGGRNIWLESTSTNGSIGTSAAPLVLNAVETRGSNSSVTGGLVYAKAQGDVVLRDDAGDFSISGAHSTSGNVWLSAPNGSIVDASGRLAFEGLSGEELKAIQKRLKLDGSGVADSIAAYERQISSDYTMYWSLVSYGQIVGGSYVPDSAAEQAFSAQALAAGRGADVGAYLTELYADIAARFDQAYGADWNTLPEFGSARNNYAFTLDPTSALAASFGANAVWNSNDLSYTFNAATLEPSQPSVGKVDPTVSGVNVTLSARDGVGRLAPDLEVPFASFLDGSFGNNLEAVRALLLADAPGDVELLDADGNVLPFYLLKNAAPGEFTASDIRTVRIRRTSPLYLAATGNLTISANGSSYLQSTRDLSVAGITIGNSADNLGDLRLAVDGNLSEATGLVGPAISTRGDLVLSVSGDIGSNVGGTGQNLLDVKVDGEVSSASAGGKMGLRQTTGDLRFGHLYAGSTMVLDVPNGSLRSVLPGISLDANSLNFSVRDHVGGPAGGALNMRIGASGQVNGSAGGNVNIGSPDSPLTIGTLTSGRDMLISTASKLTAAVLSAGNRLTASAGGGMSIGGADSGDDMTLQSMDDFAADSLTSAGDLIVTSGRGLALTDVDVVGATSLYARSGKVSITDGGVVSSDSVVVDAAGMAMGAGSAIEAQQALNATVTGDMVLGHLAVAGSAAGGTLALVAGGSITGNGDAAINLLAGKAVDVALTAGTGIGTSTLALSSSGGMLEALAHTGDIHLLLPDGGTVTAVNATTGGIQLQAADSLLLGNAVAAQDVVISGTDITASGVVQGANVNVTGVGQLVLNQLTAANNAVLDSGNDMTVTAMDVTGNADLTAGAALALSQGTVGGNATLVSTGSTTLGSLAVIGDAAASAGTTMTLDTLDVGGNAVLDSGNDMTVTTMDVTGNADLTAGAALALSQGTVGGNATLVSTGGSSIGSLSAQGTLDATSGAALAAGALSSGSSMMLSSGSTLDVQQLNAGGDLMVDAVDTLSIGNANVSGNATVDGQSDVVLGTAAIGKALAVNAGTDLTATTLTVTGNSTLITGGNTTVTTFDGQGDLSATAGGNLRLDEGTVGGNATLASIGSTTLGSLAVTGDAAASAGTTMTLDTLDVGGNAVLDSGNDMTVTTMDVTGNADLTAGAALALSQGTVGGNATLFSAGGSSIGSLSAQGTLDVTSGAALAAGALSSGSSMMLSSGNRLDVQQLNAGGDLMVDAVDTLSIANANVSGNATVGGQSDVVLGTAAIGKALAVNAGTDLTATTLTVTGNSTLITGGNTTVTTFDGQGDLSATAGGNLRLDEGIVGGNATLFSTDGSSIGSLSAQGALEATSGAALAAGALSSGSSMRLSSGSTLDVQQLNAGGDLMVDAVDTLSIGNANVSGNATVDGQSDVVLGTAAIGKALAVNAGTDLTATTLTVTGNSTLITGGNTTVTTFDGQGDLSATAGGNLRLDEGTVGGNATLASIGSTTLGSLAVTGDAAASAGTTMTLDTLDVGGNAVLDSGNDMTVTTLDVTGNADLTAGAALALSQGTVGGNATLVSTGGSSIGSLSAQGTLDVTSGAALAAGALSSGSNMRLSSGSTLDVQQLNAGGDLRVDAVDTLSIGNANVGGNATVDGQSDVVLGTAAIGKALGVNAGTDLTATTLTVTGNSTLITGGNTTVTTFDGQGDLSATAGGNLRLDEGTVGGNATLVIADGSSIGSLSAQGTLDATSGAALAAGALSSGSSMRLSSGSTLDVQQLNAGGDLRVDAADTLSIANANVSGNATVDGQSDVVLGTAVIGKALVVNAGTDLTGTTLTVTGNSTLITGGNTTVTTFDGQGDLSATAGGNLRLDEGTVGGNATLASTGSTTLGSLAVTGDAAASAGTTMTLDTLDVRGNAVLDSGNDMTVTTMDVTGNADLTAGAALALSQGTVGGNATLVIADGSSIGSLSAQGTLDATSGAALAAGALSSGSSMRLSSGSTLDVQQLNAGGDLRVDAVDTLSIGNANVSGNATVDGQSDVVLGTAAIGKALAVNAGTDLTATTLTVTGNSTLITGGNTTVTTFDGQGDLSATAGNNITLGTASTGTAMNLRAGRAIDVGTAHIGTDGTWQAGTDLKAKEITAGCNFTGDAGGVVAIGSLLAGCNVSLASDSALTFDAVQADNNLSLTSRGSDVIGDSAVAGGALQVNAAGAIDIDKAIAGKDIVANSGTTQTWGSYQAGQDAALVAGGDVAIGDGRSGGMQSIISGGSIHFDRIAAGTRASMDAKGGSLSGGSLTAASGSLAARDHLVLSQGMIDTRLNLAADTIDANVAQASTGTGPLTTTLTGYHNGVARKITLEVDPRDAWLIDQLRAVDAELASTAGKVDIDSGYIEHTMTLQTPKMRVLMDNTSPRLRPFDVQLTQPSRSFRVSADGVYINTDAYAVRFNDGYRVTSPNYNNQHAHSDMNYLGEAAVRYMGRLLQLDPAYEDQSPELRLELDMSGDLVKSEAGAVNLGAPN